MCGRYYIPEEDVSEDLRQIIEEISRRHNGDDSVKTSGEIFPSDIVPVMAGADGAPAALAMRWGFALPDGMLFTDFTGEPGDSCVPVTEGGEGGSELFDLKMDQHIDDMNVGGILPGEIGDTVWLDKDGNGLQDYREPLIPGVTLTLLRVLADGSMEEAAAAQSDKYGYYVFESLRPGTYVLRLDAQGGEVLTYHFGEPLGEIDSDIDPDTRMSAPVALRSGQILRNIDVGLIEHGE